jgi:phosphoribosyl 1,2-cyclic phosphodiesterase
MNIYPIASGSTGNCILISHGGYNLLLDAGIKVTTIRKHLQKNNIRLTQIDGCLISHGHGDHSKSIKDLCELSIDCYMSQDTAKMLNINHHRVHIVDPGKLFYLSRCHIYPFPVKHDLTNYGYVICYNDYKYSNKTILYTTDMQYIKFAGFKGLTHILIECNYDLNTLRENVNNGKINESAKYRIMKNHMNLETVKNFLKANDLNQVEEIWLLHMSKNNIDANYAKEEIQKLTGKIVKIGG